VEGEDMWNIYYKGIYNDDPFWHLYNDFVGAPVFKTKREAKEYVENHKKEFDGCRIQIKRHREYV
jgi:hypothetical protein